LEDFDDLDLEEVPEEVEVGAEEVCEVAEGVLMGIGTDVRDEVVEVVILQDDPVQNGI